MSEDDMQTEEECHLEEQLRAKCRETAELEAQLEAKTEARRKAKQLAGLKRQRTELEHQRAAIVRESDDIAKQHAELKRRASELQRQRDDVVMQLQHVAEQEAALMQGAPQDAAPHGTPSEAPPEKRAKTASSSPIPALSDGHVGEMAGSHGGVAAQALPSPPESNAAGMPAAVRSPAANGPTPNGAKPPQPTSAQRAHASDSAPAASQYSPMPDATSTEVDDLPLDKRQRRRVAMQPDAGPSTRTSDTTDTMAAAASAMVGLSRRRPAMEESTLGNCSPSATPLGNEATTNGGALRPRVSLPPPPPGSQQLPPPSHPTMPQLPLLGSHKPPPHAQPLPAAMHPTIAHGSSTPGLAAGTLGAVASPTTHAPPATPQPPIPTPCGKDTEAYATAMGRNGGASTNGRMHMHMPAGDPAFIGGTDANAAVTTTERPPGISGGVHGRSAAAGTDRPAPLRPAVSLDNPPRPNKSPSTSPAPKDHAQALSEPPQPITFVLPDAKSVSYLYVPASLTRRLFGGVRRPDTVMFLAIMPPQGDAVTELGGPFAVHNRPRNQPFPGIESTGRHTGEAASGWSQLKKALNLKARDTVGMRLRADGRVEMWKLADGMAQRAQDKADQAARKAAVATMQSAAAAGLAAGRPAATPPPPSASRPGSVGKPGGGGGSSRQRLPTAASPSGALIHVSGAASGSSGGSKMPRNVNAKWRSMSELAAGLPTNERQRDRGAVTGSSGGGGKRRLPPAGSPTVGPHRSSPAGGVAGAATAAPAASTGPRWADGSAGGTPAAGRQRAPGSTPAARHQGASTGGADAGASQQHASGASGSGAGQPSPPPRSTLGGEHLQAGSGDGAAGGGGGGGGSQVGAVYTQQVRPLHGNPGVSRPQTDGGDGRLQQQRSFDPKAAAMSPVQHRQQQLVASCHAAAAAHHRQQLQQPPGQRPAAGPAAGTAAQQQQLLAQRAGVPVVMAQRPQQQRPPGQHVGPPPATAAWLQRQPQQVAGQRSGAASAAEAVASQQRLSEQRPAVACQQTLCQPVHGSAAAVASSAPSSERQSAPHGSHAMRPVGAGGTLANSSKPAAAAAAGDGRSASAEAAVSSGSPAAGPAAGPAAEAVAMKVQRSAGSASTISEGRDASPEPAISL